MVKRVICSQCGAECEYNPASRCEGNREQENYECPDCGFVLETVFTDQIPYVRIVKHGNIVNNQPYEK